MEPLHVSTESFSSRWMTNLNPSSGIGSRRRSSDSFIELDLGFISRRSNDFDFSNPNFQATFLVHADDIFTNDLIQAESCSILRRVLSLESSQRLLAPEDLPKSRLMFGTPLSSSYQDRKQRLRKCFGSSRIMLKKYLFFLVPLYKKVKGLRMNPSKSPTKRVEWCCSSSTADSRIYDAILHCKKSIAS